jgi:hypothetical protein
MPQVFQVVKCCNCSIYQVDQKKLTLKWTCKVCGQKQSLKQVTIHLFNQFFEELNRIFV